MKLDSILNLGKNRRLADKIGEFGTLIGRESVFEGGLGGGDNYLVQGRVTGNSSLEGSLVLTDSGRWQGNINAQNVVIAGEVEGDIVARERLVLTETAKVRGNLSAPAVAIAEGAMLVGEVRMTAASQVTRYNERRASRERDTD